MKKIMINLLSFSEEKYYGVGVYFRDVIASNMNEIFMCDDCEITIIHLEHISIGKMFPIPERDNIKYLPIGGLYSRVRRVMFEQVKLPFMLRGFNVIYSPNNINPVLLPHACNSIITIHDLLPFKKENRFGLIQRIYLRLFTALCSRSAKKIVTVSHYSKDDITRTLNVDKDKIKVTYNVLSQQKMKIINTHDKIADEYFFSVGALQKDKQFDLMINAFNDYISNNQTECHLVIAGGDQGAKDELSELIKKLGLTERVHLLGYISEDDKWSYYAGCTALILLGKNEGFGIPVLEAMSLYKPSIVANTGALPEIVGKVGFVVKSDSESVAHAMSVANKTKIEFDAFEQELKRFSKAKQVHVLSELFERCF